VFTAATPVSQEEVQRTLYLALFGVFAAAAEANLSTFAASLEELQSSAWKAAEWRAHGPGLPDVAAVLRNAGARGIGLSSMGPALFFCAQGVLLHTLPEALRYSVLITKPRNCGRKVLVDDFVAA
jgi:beta-ribofuranosylaminobenzene 5'-phosphate synthase